MKKYLYCLIINLFVFGCGQDKNPEPLKYNLFGNTENLEFVDSIRYKLDGSSIYFYSKIKAKGKRLSLLTHYITLAPQLPTLEESNSYLSKFKEIKDSIYEFNTQIIISFLEKDKKYFLRPLALLNSGQVIYGAPLSFEYSTDEYGNNLQIYINDEPYKNDTYIPPIIDANDNKEGNIAFWTNSSGSVIKVKIANLEQKITGYYEYSTPSCNSQGVALFNLKYGTYEFSANDNEGNSWGSTIVIDKDCRTFLLTK